MGFLSLIKPLNWAFPTIYSLPSNCLEMLSSPLPIISGINCDYPYAKKHLFSNYSNNDHLIFVFIEDDYILASKNLIKDTKIPNFSQSFKKLKSNYGHFFKKEKSKNVKIDFNKRRFCSKKGSYKQNGGKESGKRVIDEDEILIFLHEIRDIIVGNFVDVLPETLEEDDEQQVNI